MGEGKGKGTAGVLCILAGLCLLAYSNTFSVPFHFDDLRVIRFNFSLRDLANWEGIFSSEPFRPLLIATFAWNYKIGKLEPFTYHAFNLVCHYLALVLFYFLLKKQSSNALFAAVAAFLMAVHPLNTEAVTYISSRTILLCAVFYFASLLFIDSYFRKGKLLSLIFFLLFFLLALLTKEDGVLIPFAALLYNALFFGKDSVRKYRFFHLGTLAFVFLAGAFRIYAYFDSAQAPYPFFTWLATEVTVWFRYLWLALWPVSLNIDPDIRAVSFVDPLFWFSLALFCVAAVLVWKYRKTHALLCFWCVWFFLNLMVSSSLVPLTDFMAEHRVYISMFGFCAGLSYLAFVISAKSLLSKIAMCLLICFYSFAAFQRNAIWKSELTLWYDSAGKSPNKIRPHLNLAGAYIQEKAFDLAIQEYLFVTRLNPSIPQTYSGLGICHLRKGNLQTAENAFKKGLELDPGLIDSKTGLGMIRYGQGRFEEALAFFREVYPHRRESIQLAAMMSDACMKLGYHAEAIPILEHALKLNPGRKDLKKRLEEAYRR